MDSDQNHRCDTCTLCCRLTRVPELDKPVDVWCRSCDVGKGCLTYLSRPESCKTYQCLWLSGSLGPDLRPDKCKVIFERMPSGKTYLALVDPGRPDAWKKKDVQAVIHGLLMAGRFVVVKTKPVEYLLPPGKTRKQLFDDLKEAVKAFGLKE